MSENMPSAQEIKKKEKTIKSDADVVGEKNCRDCFCNIPTVGTAIKEVNNNNNNNINNNNNNNNNINNNNNNNSSQGSFISLDYLKMGGNSSKIFDQPSSDVNIVVADEQPKIEEKNEMNLRVEIYRPITPITLALDNQKIEVMTVPKKHHAIVEEPQIQILAPQMHFAVIEEPKVELLSPSTYHAIIEEPKIGILRTADGDEIIMLSDEDEAQAINHEIYESADELDDDQGNQNIDILQPTIQAIDSRCCARSRVRETRETQTPATTGNRNRAPGRQRTRAVQPTSMVMVGTSSNYDSSEQLQQKLKVNAQPAYTFKQRQLELHRHRIAVEQKRLELLELKLARERDEMLRERILFEKELDLKAARIRKFNEDRLDL